MLSEKEFKVFLALAKGQSVAEIAGSHVFEPSHHRPPTFTTSAETCASNSAELAIIAIRAGLIAP